MKAIACGVLVGLALTPVVRADDFATLKRQFDYATKAPLDAQEKLLYEREGVKVYDLTYASPKGGRVTAYLVVPAAKGPHAGLVFGHWGQGNRTEFLPEATLYARAGAASVLIDYPWARPAPWRRPLKQENDPEGDHALFVQAVIDLRRGLDLLAAREGVDPKRLGYVGHSFGAQWGAHPVGHRAAAQGGDPGGRGSGPGLDLAGQRRPGHRRMWANTPKERQETYLQSATRTAAVRYVPHATCPRRFSSPGTSSSSTGPHLSANQMLYASPQAKEVKLGPHAATTSTTPRSSPTGRPGLASASDSNL